MAASRTSVEPPRTEVRDPGEGLSVQTLIIAAIASGIAAVVVSHFWARGTILFSAMTPVAIAIISEMLRKPVESERLRGSMRAASSYARPRSGRTPRVIAPPPADGDEGLQRREEGVDPGPVRLYSSGSHKRPRDPEDGSSPRRRRLKLAVITGLVAFLIAAMALTLPELIFGGSVGGGGGNTTYFGGGESTNDKGESQDGESGDPSSGPNDQGGEQQSPDSTGSGGGEDPSQDPEGETTTPESEPETPPSEAPPPQTSPAPAPAPSAPAP